MITRGKFDSRGSPNCPSRPEFADRIAAEILKVARARYATPECRNLAIGHAVLALEEMLDRLGNPARPAICPKSAQESRPATRRKAEQFLNRVKKQRAQAPRV